MAKKPTGAADGRSLSDAAKFLTFIVDGTKDDRAVAVLTGSYVDGLVRSALESALVGLTPDLRRSLFEGLGPLSSTRAKIDLAGAMGLYETDVLDALRKINSIRNRFAHSFDADSFDAPEIATRADAIVIPEVAHHMARHFGYEPGSPWVSTPKGKYLMLVFAISLRLENLAAGLHHVLAGYRKQAASMAEGIK